jgi:protein-S-isoprenylcysteine O-methyltransferase Ste14
MSGQPAFLDTRIPPPILLLLTGAGMWLLARHWPQFAFDLPWRHGLAIAIALPGLLLGLLPKLRFDRAGTTVNPLRPERASHLVVDGANGYSRNPMYLGMSLLLLAWVVFLANAASTLLLPVFMLYITRFQILPEEHALATRFGDNYADYRARVRRWL